MRVPPEAALHDGLFTRADARRAGIAHTTVRRRLASGAWSEVLPNVMCAGAPELTGVGSIRAATWSAKAPASHLSAALLHGLECPQDGRVHITTSRSLHRALPGVHEHRLRLTPTELEQIDGIDVTTRTRTVIDLLAWLPDQVAHTFAFRAMQQRWIQRQDISAAIQDRRFMSGNDRLRQLERMTISGAHSMAEWRGHEILDRIPGLRYRANVTIRLGGSIAIVDVLVDGVPLVIEIDGRRHHESHQQFTHDRRRQNALISAGYLVLRYTWDDLTRRPNDVEREITTQWTRLRY